MRVCNRAALIAFLKVIHGVRTITQYGTAKPANDDLINAQPISGSSSGKEFLHQPRLPKPLLSGSTPLRPPRLVSPYMGSEHESAARRWWIGDSDLSIFSSFLMSETLTPGIKKCLGKMPIPYIGHDQSLSGSSSPAVTGSIADESSQ